VHFFGKVIDDYFVHQLQAEFCRKALRDVIAE
jgi:hypothetical protein